ncbi:hypothetical protein R3P38DRAFT_3190745 [Favolaschia claudopus]|uniref:Uncharacterized protein n=1 Tax=Favolaschia claudopus TaxID=2862362 RepID=A0AAW0BNH8_9AGAR
MPIPLTTTSKLSETVQLMEMLFDRSPRLSGILMATGLEEPVSIRIPWITNSLQGLWFRPWFGVVRETVEMAAEMAVVTPRQAPSNDADLGIAIIHINQRNDAHHPANRCIKTSFGEDEGDWFGNIILLEVNMRTNGIRSLCQNHGEVAAECLMRFVLHTSFNFSSRLRAVFLLITAKQSEMVWTSAPPSEESCMRFNVLAISPHTDKHYANVVYNYM